MISGIRVEYNLTELRDLAKRYPNTVRDEAEAVLSLVAARLESEVVERTPAGVGGAAGLRGSIHGTLVSGAGMPVRAVVGTPLEYGLVVEEGRRAGKRMPPVEPIALWARRKLGVPEDEADGVAYAIARKIATQGFEGAQMFARAWAENEAWAQGMLYGIAGRVAGRLNKG